MSKNYIHEATILKVKYKGLREWMLKNMVSITELERRCNASKMYKSLVGNCSPSKKNIDAILAVTGLTYEECFKEDNNDQN